MAKYRDIADDLRRRIAEEELPVDSQLPGISELQRRYDASLGTIRAAQGILRDEGLLRTAQGEGSFVVGLPPSGATNVLDELRVAQAAINAAIVALENRNRTPQIP